MKNLTSGRVALVLSGMALLIALSGAAYAANTVRSADIVNGTIKTEDLGTGSVRGIDIRNGTVAPNDLVAGTLGRTPAVMARVNGLDGSLMITRGGVSPATHNSTGRFTIQAGRDITGCIYVVTPRASDVAAGADQASTTAVNVYLEDPSSGPIDTDFDIVFFC
jgi:hypothetical protein